MSIPAGSITTVPESEWVPFPPGIALAPAVVAAAERWPIAVRPELNDEGLHVFLTCADCDQSILPLAAPSGAYRVRITDVTAQLLAHLQQRHGWTREVPGA